MRRNDKGSTIGICSSSLKAVLPVSGSAFAVSDGDDRYLVGIVEVDDGEGEAMEDEATGSVEIFWPVLWGLNYVADRAGYCLAKFQEAIVLRARYQRIESRKSSFASGWNRNGLLSIRELFGKFSEHLFAGDRFYAAGADVIDAAFDLVVPGGFDAFFGGLFIEAGETARAFSRSSESCGVTRAMSTSLRLFYASVGWVLKADSRFLLSRCARASA
jgi:hypothetical protein